MGDNICSNTWSNMIYVVSRVGKRKDSNQKKKKKKKRLEDLFFFFLTGKIFSGKIFTKNRQCRTFHKISVLNLYQKWLKNTFREVQFLIKLYPVSTNFSKTELCHIQFWNTLTTCPVWYFEQLFWQTLYKSLFESI